MYDTTIKNKVINDLEQKVISIVNTNLALSVQGYIINNRKKVKLDWTSILLHAFENLDVLNTEQQHNVEFIYNNLFKE